MRENDFEDCYTDGDDFDSGWILPGSTVACDPNWHGGNLESFTKIKWSFLAVDNKAQTFFDEALVSKDSVSLVNKNELTGQ